MNKKENWKIAEELIKAVLEAEKELVETGVSYDAEEYFEELKKNRFGDDMFIPAEEVYREHGITEEDLEGWENIEFEDSDDEYDAAVAEEAYEEYVKSGYKSTPVEDLWRELDEADAAARATDKRLTHEEVFNGIRQGLREAIAYNSGELDARSSVLSISEENKDEYDTNEKLQLDSEIYKKLLEAEREAEATDVRYTSKDIIASMNIILTDDEIDAAIYEAEKEFAETGIAYDAREALATLREKYFGEKKG